MSRLEIEDQLVMRRTFWIGVFPGLAQAQLDCMVESMGAFCQNAGRL